MTLLPPELEQSTFEEAIDAFTVALDPDAVVTDPEALTEFPTRTCTGYALPLWTIGQGRNNTYGGASSRVKGSVLVNLRNMNRVREINQQLANAVVEPGVRWFDLADALLEAGGDLWTSLPDIGWGSPIGNALENGVGFTPLGDHASNLCGLEVVLPRPAATTAHAWRRQQRRRAQTPATIRPRCCG
jgi:FAD/FMN-containing dehydrogenase